MKLITLAASLCLIFSATSMLNADAPKNPTEVKKTEKVKKMKKVDIYSTVMCPYCVKAKDFMREKGIEYIEHLVDRDQTAAAEMKKRTDRRTVPQIFIGNVHVGGYTDMVEKDKNGELEKLLCE